MKLFIPKGTKLMIRHGDPIEHSSRKDGAHVWTPITTKRDWITEDYCPYPHNPGYWKFDVKDWYVVVDKERCHQI